MTNRAWIGGIRGKLAANKLQRQLKIGEGAPYRFGLESAEEMETRHPGIEFLER